MALLTNATRAIRATAVWQDVPVASITKATFKAARQAGIHNISDKDIKTLGTFTEVLRASTVEEWKSDTAAKVYAQGIQLKRLRKDKKELAAAYGALAASTQLLDQDRQPNMIKAYSPHKPKNKRAAAAFAILSDTHVEETVDGTMVSGVNHFDLKEAERRLERFFQGALWLVDHHRTSFHIDTFVLALLGDMISGFIHDELVESNSLPPTHAIFWLVERLEKGIQLLLEDDKLEKIVIPCCFGNHARTTPERRIQTIAASSFEWLLYQFLQHTFKEEGRVDFIIAAGELLHISVYDQTIRFTHGDAVRGTIKPIGPLAAALPKIESWDRLLDQPAAVTVCGHHHKYLSHPIFVSNGSLIGYGPYAQHLAAHYEEPSQAFFLLDAERGKTMDAAIWVADSPKRQSAKKNGIFTVEAAKRLQAAKGSYKLTEEDVEEVRHSDLSQRQLATKFGISQPQISRIQNFKSRQSA